MIEIEFEPMEIAEVVSLAVSLFTGLLTPSVIGYGIYAMMKANRERAVASDRINEALANSNAALSKAIEGMDKTMEGLDKSNGALAKTMEGLDKSNTALAKVLERL